MKKRPNRKKRKKRIMDLKRMGMEIYKPHWNDIITTSPHNFTFKIAKHFNGMEIKAGKMRGYEFTRPICKNKNTIDCDDDIDD